MGSFWQLIHHMIVPGTRADEMGATETTPGEVFDMMFNSTKEQCRDFLEYASKEIGVIYYQKIHAPDGREWKFNLEIAEVPQLSEAKKVAQKVYPVLATVAAGWCIVEVLRGLIRPASQKTTEENR